MTAHGDDATLTVLVGLGLMFLGLTIITLAALVEAKTGRSNWVMRWLWRQ